MRVTALTEEDWGGGAPPPLELEWPLLSVRECDRDCDDDNCDDKRRCSSRSCPRWSMPFFFDVLCLFLLDATELNFRLYLITPQHLTKPTGQWEALQSYPIISQVGVGQRLPSLVSTVFWLFRQLANCSRPAHGSLLLKISGTSYARLRLRHAFRRRRARTCNSGAPCLLQDSYELVTSRLPLYPVLCRPLAP